jgi:hypothetical protein
MAHLEDLLPEIRRGRKHKRKSWSETYVMFDTSDHSYGVYTNAGGFIELMELGGDDILADNWELVSEPKKYKASVYLWSDGYLTSNEERYGYMGAPRTNMPHIVETREIEWEVPE